MDIIKEPWTSIEIEAVLFDESIGLEVAYFRPDGSEESRVRTIMLADYFYELAKVVSTEDKGLYKKCKFVLKNDGNFNVDFEY
ncbi:hypothetical protein Q8W40_05450 [Vibrio penaeicida]|uniref:hypothetical protein n=1 Tax=Vibrio penaeicida TaxID=104609 RepID=UPI0027346E32|nr:hypothetical protein [Vibrio penaeicida]MDP2571617.1 hypothetical protein [Vibrio penaeicida]